MYESSVKKTSMMIRYSKKRILNKVGLEENKKAAVLPFFTYNTWLIDKFGKSIFLCILIQIMIIWIKRCHPFYFSIIPSYIVENNI